MITKKLKIWLKEIYAILKLMKYIDRQRRLVRFVKKLQMSNMTWQFRGVPIGEIEGRLFFQKQKYKNIMRQLRNTRLLRKLFPINRIKDEINELLVIEQLIDSCKKDGYLVVGSNSDAISVVPGTGDQFIEHDYWFVGFTKNPLVIKHFQFLVFMAVILVLGILYFVFHTDIKPILNFIKMVKDAIL